MTKYSVNPNNLPEITEEMSNEALKFREEKTKYILSKDNPSDFEINLLKFWAKTYNNPLLLEAIDKKNRW